MLISDPNFRITARMGKNLNIFNKEFDNSVLTDGSKIILRSTNDIFDYFFN